LQRPIESTQYTSYAFTQVLDDHAVLTSIGSVGDAYDPRKQRLLTEHVDGLPVYLRFVSA
jgi:hypothetical protein